MTPAGMLTIEWAGEWFRYWLGRTPGEWRPLDAETRERLSRHVSPPPVTRAAPPVAPPPLPDFTKGYRR